MRAHLQSLLARPRTMAQSGVINEHWLWSAVAQSGANRRGVVVMGYPGSSTIWTTSVVSFSVDMNANQADVSPNTMSELCARGRWWSMKCWVLVRRRAGVLLLGLKTSSGASGAVNGEMSLWTLAQNLADALRSDRLSCAPWAAGEVSPWARA